MNADSIEEIGIDSFQRLYVKPSVASFPYIYREAMEVYWEPNGRFLYSPKPREWTYFNWFCQIMNAAAEQSWFLSVTSETKWCAIPDELKLEIRNWMATRSA